MLNDFSNMEVLVTGGTRGIGLATGLAFAKQGAQCTLTYSWGSVDNDEVKAAFAAAGCAKPPRLIQADVSSNEATSELLERIAEKTDRIDVFVSSVALSALVGSIDDYDFRALEKSMRYSAWPFVEYLQGIIKRFSRPPRYVIGFSSPGADQYLDNYDFVAACKAVLETWCRYLTYRLIDQDCHINIIRTERVETESAKIVLGQDAFELARRYFPEGILNPEAAANAALALSSGLMDAVRGQVIEIDRGVKFFQNAMYFYDEGRLEGSPSHRD